MNMKNKTLHLVVSLLFFAIASASAQIRVTFTDHRDGTVTVQRLLPPGATQPRLLLYRGIDFVEDELRIALARDPRADFGHAFRTFRLDDNDTRIPFLPIERGNHYLFQIVYLDAKGELVRLGASPFRLSLPEKAPARQAPSVPTQPAVPRDPFFEGADGKASSRESATRILVVPGVATNTTGTTTDNTGRVDAARALEIQRIKERNAEMVQGDGFNLWDR